MALGARHGWATDIESQALEATRANAALNGVAERLTVLAPEALPELKVDIVAANILAGPLIALAPHLAASVRPGGAVVLSGVLEAQAAGVLSAYEPYFAEVSIVSQLGWVRLAGIRRTRVNATTNR